MPLKITLRFKQHNNGTHRFMRSFLSDCSSLHGSSLLEFKVTLTSAVSIESNDSVIF